MAEPGDVLRLPPDCGLSLRGFSHGFSFDLYMVSRPLLGGFFHACDLNFHEAGCVQMPL